MSRRGAQIVVLVAFAALALAGVVALFGGPDSGDLWSLGFGLALLLWVAIELREDRSSRLSWVGLGAAVLLIGASLGALLF